MSLEKNEHVPILDSLRAIAALSVCVYHFVCGPINFITNEYVLTFFSFGKYGVQLFFVISGFVIPWSLSSKNYEIKKYFRFLLKRFLRLEPPYLFSIILVVTLFLCRGFYTTDPDSRIFTSNQLFLHLGYLIPFSHYDWIIDVYWTLAIEFQFYLFMGLFYFLIVSGNMKLRIAGYVMCLSLAFIGTREFLPYWLPVFLIGNLVFLFITKKISSMEFYIVVTSILVYLVLLYPLPIFFSSLIPAAALVFFFKYSNRFLNWIGKISYSIYLIHTIVGTATINVLSHHAHSAIAKVAVVCTGVAVSVIFSYLMYLFIEKPSKKLSSKISL